MYVYVCVCMCMYVCMCVWRYVWISIRLVASIYIYNVRVAFYFGWFWCIIDRSSQDFRTRWGATEQPRWVELALKLENWRDVYIHYTTTMYHTHIYIYIYMYYRQSIGLFQNGLSPSLLVYTPKMGHTPSLNGNCVGEHGDFTTKPSSRPHKSYQGVDGKIEEGALKEALLGSRICPHVQEYIQTYNDMKENMHKQRPPFRS